MTVLDPNTPQNTPPLSKLLNRDRALERLATELDRSQRESKHRFSMLLVQFDGLSRLTDRVGRASLSEVWGQALRILWGDVSAQDLCARLGGDDFLLIFHGRDESDRDDLIEHLHRRWMPAVNMREAAIEMHVGFVSYPTHGTTVQQLFAAADEAMQEDKNRKIE